MAIHVEDRVLKRHSIDFHANDNAILLGSTFLSLQKTGLLILEYELRTDLRSLLGL